VLPLPSSTHVKGFHSHFSSGADKIRGRNTLLELLHSSTFSYCSTFPMSSNNIIAIQRQMLAQRQKELMMKYKGKPASDRTISTSTSTSSRELSLRSLSRDPLIDISSGSKSLQKMELVRAKSADSSTCKKRIPALLPPPPPGLRRGGAPPSITGSPSCNIIRHQPNLQEQHHGR
jgi:hypothetical protein